MSAGDLWDTFDLDLWTGRLIHRHDDKKRHRRKGAVAGTKDPAPNGYHYISWNQRRILLHRAVFLWVYGVQPTNEVDHIDRRRANNCPFNLRLATRRGQALNSVIHFQALGVRQVSHRWYAYHSVNKRVLSVGGFDTEAEALAARKALVIAAQAFS
jgi:hypothetical protein